MSATLPSRVTRIALSPTAGFVVKSVSTTPAIYTLPKTSQPTAQNVLEPTHPTTLTIPKGIKVFLNIAWDKNVPAPPPADEGTIRRAMMAEDVDAIEGAYVVPVVVSEPREDVDKSGKQSIVFDCLFSSKLKSRCTKDNDFRLYLIELALEHVEAKARIQLSRQIGTPNIASKGKLEPRTVLVPTELLDPSAHSQPQKPLVEIMSESAQNKGKGKATVPSKSILKNSSASTTAGVEKPKPLIEEVGESSDRPQAADVTKAEKLSESASASVPRWHWTKEDDLIKMTIDVPKLTHKLHASSTLDIEPRRVLLSIPNTYFLDVNLDLPDAQIGKIDSNNGNYLPEPLQHGAEGNAWDADNMKVKGNNAGEALRLKRMRDLDIEGAKAEWQVAAGSVVIWV